MRVSPDRAGGDDVAYIVLIVLAHSSSVGELSKLHVKHRTTRNSGGQHRLMRVMRALAPSQISHVHSTEKG